MLFFHRELFETGFLGVDIFFVISGYLMFAHNSNLTGWSEVVDFCRRRLKRIYPSLVVSLPFFLLFSYFFLSQSAFEQAVTSLHLTLLSVQNFFFLSEIDYFQPEIVSPTVHFWSIAVEVQFYAVFAVMLFFPKSMRKPLALLAGFVSFVLYSQYSHTLAAFYLLPFRIWEFVAPMAVLLVRDRLGLLRSATMTWIMICIGIAAIGWAMEVGSRELVVLGASLFAVFASHIKFRKSRVLDSAARLTYEGYLTHLLFVGFSPALYLFGTAISAFFLERLSRLRLAMLGSILLLVCGTFSIQTSRLQNVFSERALLFERYEMDNSVFSELYESAYSQLQAYTVPTSLDDETQELEVEDNSILVLGDSFAGEFFLSLSEEKFLRSRAYYYSVRMNCLDQNETQRSRLLGFLETNSSKISAVFMDANYTKETCDDGTKASSVGGLKFAVSTFSERNIPVVVAEPRPFFPGPIDFNFVDRAIVSSKPGTAIEVADQVRERAFAERQLNLEYRKAVTELLNGNVHIFPFPDLLCSEAKERCKVLLDDGSKVVFDYGHVSSLWLPNLTEGLVKFIAETELGTLLLRKPN